MCRPSEIALSFNGGKDCTVVLHLLRSCTDDLSAFKFVHFVQDNEFNEVTQFRKEVEAKFGIEIQLYGKDFKREVGRFIDESGVKAIVMGNRRTDPWSQQLEAFTPSSAGWPEFMRVFPILEWSYADVWLYLRGPPTLEYCCLYDLGYTPLGETHNTQKNPKLKSTEEEGAYRPAYELKNGDDERLSRC